MAELADAYGSGPYGATLGGSNPLVSNSLFTRPVLRQQDPEFVRGTFASISKRYDFANHLLSGGLDFLWRDVVARRVAAAGPCRILDLATGSGDLARELRRKCPGALVVGGDFCLPMLAEASRKSVPCLVQADGLALPFAEASFDAVTVAFGLRNMASWSGALAECARVLREGGELHVLDFAMPSQPVLRAIYRVYLHRVLPRIAGWVTARADAYEYLGESIESFPSGGRMQDLFRHAGFAPRVPRLFCFGVVALYTGCLEKKAVAISR